MTAAQLYLPLRWSIMADDGVATFVDAVIDSWLQAERGGLLSAQTVTKFTSVASRFVMFTEALDIAAIQDVDVDVCRRLSTLTERGEQESERDRRWLRCTIGALSFGRCMRRRGVSASVAPIRLLTSRFPIATGTVSVVRSLKKRLIKSAFSLTGGLAHGIS
ncbi:hypothetical protein [Gordonia sp. (in: high G+C Gram-positive bacteria)]|uniref:hypothetical protein n=1 Tax=Gordonia sp. (in: high G+C Gram-positive bacteria) TaxID=84139 RepID=UPI003F959078